MSTPEPTRGEHFDQKGKAAEKFVTELAQQTFLIDWCYPSPQCPKKKEICDLLVIFDDIAIIWQVKDLKTNVEGEYSEREVKKNLKQLRGAERRLFETDGPIMLVNSRRKAELFDPSKIKRRYLISAMLGDGSVPYPMFGEERGALIHCFDREATKVLLSELDTVRDFTDYLSRREAVLSNPESILVCEGEDELLAYYLHHNQCFDGLNQFNAVHMKEGSWTEFRASKACKDRKAANEISYEWDALINLMHTSQSDFEYVARELARPNRLQRRILAKHFRGALARARDLRPDVDSYYRHGFTLGGTTYGFLLMDNNGPWGSRTMFLKAFCIVLRKIIPANNKVIGISTQLSAVKERTIVVDLLEIEEWTNMYQQVYDRIKDCFGMTCNPHPLVQLESDFPTF